MLLQAVGVFDFESHLICIWELLWWNKVWMVDSVCCYFSFYVLKIERCFVYDYLLTGCVNINVNCTVVVVESEYSKKRIENELETTNWCNKK